MKPKRLVHGVGINDADYIVEKREEIGYVNGVRKRKLIWRCPYFQVWKNMLERCYSTKFQERRPTYKNCTVAEDWHTFSNFRTWMETQDFEGLQIDKDLLIVGNKVYSPETCMFVTGAVNNFAIDRGNDRGEWLVGVDWDKRREKFRANCRNPLNSKKEHLGYFDTEQQAHNAWMKRKNELAHELATIQTDPRVSKALISRYSRVS